MKAVALAISLLIVAVFFAACESNPLDPAVDYGKIETENPTTPVNKSVSSAGGKVEVELDNGEDLVIEVPRGTFPSSSTFTVSTATVTSHNLPDDYRAASPLITIDHGGGFGDEIMHLTIPIELAEGEFACAFFYDDQTGELELIPPVGLSSDRIEVATRHFDGSTFRTTSSITKSLGPRVQNGGETAAKIIVYATTTDLFNIDVDTKFMPGVDDFEFTNLGSIITPAGNCVGESIASMYYFTNIKPVDNQPLFHRYDEIKASHVEFDNPLGIKLASVLQERHNGFNGNEWVEDFSQKVWSWDADELHFKAAAMALSVGLDQGGKKPVQLWVLNTQSFKGHAVVAYKIARKDIHVADPNDPGGTSRKVEYTNGFVPYISRQRAGTPPLPFDRIRVIANWALISKRQTKAFWQQVNDGTIGDRDFPPLEVLYLNHQTGTYEPFTSEVSVPNSLSLNVRCEGCPQTRFGIEAWDMNGQSLGYDENSLEINTEPGKTRIGVAVTGFVNGKEEFMEYVSAEVEDRGDIRFSCEVNSVTAEVSADEDRVASFGRSFAEGTWINNQYFVREETDIGGGRKHVWRVIVIPNAAFTALDRCFVQEFELNVDQSEVGIQSYTIQDMPLDLGVDPNSADILTFTATGSSVCTYLSIGYYDRQRIRNTACSGSSSLVIKLPNNK